MSKLTKNYLKYGMTKTQLRAWCREQLASNYKNPLTLADDLCTSAYFWMSANDCIEAGYESNKAKWVLDAYCLKKERV